MGEYVNMTYGLDMIGGGSSVTCLVLCQINVVGGSTQIIKVSTGAVMKTLPYTQGYFYAQSFGWISAVEVFKNKPDFPFASLF